MIFHFCAQVGQLERVNKAANCGVCREKCSHVCAHASDGGFDEQQDERALDDIMRASGTRI